MRALGAADQWSRAMSLGQATVDENWLRDRIQQRLDELADADELGFLRANTTPGLPGHPRLDKDVPWSKVPKGA